MSWVSEPLTLFGDLVDNLYRHHDEGKPVSVTFCCYIIFNVWAKVWNNVQIEVVTW